MRWSVEKEDDLGWSPSNMIYWLKEVFGPPERYLGANFEKEQLNDG